MLVKYDIDSVGYWQVFLISSFEGIRLDDDEEAPQVRYCKYRCGNFVYGYGAAARSIIALNWRLDQDVYKGI